MEGNDVDPLGSALVGIANRAKRPGRLLRDQVGKRKRFA
jgi:hypothetical protein